MNMNIRKENDNIRSIISDLESEIYTLIVKNKDMKVGDFKELPDVKDIMTTIKVLENHYGF